MFVNHLCFFFCKFPLCFLWSFFLQPFFLLNLYVKYILLYLHFNVYHCFLKIRSCGIESYLSWCACMLSHFSHVQLFVSLCTIACQAPLSMGFSRQEYWSRLPCSPPGDLPNPGIEPRFPALAGGFLTTEQGNSLVVVHGLALQGLLLLQSTVSRAFSNCSPWAALEHWLSSCGTRA